MAQQPMFVITKSGLIIRPERLKALSDYPKRYIREAHEMVDTYLREGGREQDPVMLAMRREIDRAQAMLRDLEQLTSEVQRIYEVNFVREAEIVRRTRIALGFTRIEDVFTLSVLVDIMVAQLKAENPTCNEETFRSYINNATDDPIIITKQVRRVSA